MSERAVSCVVLAFLLVTGCKREPAEEPFGKLNREQLSEWAADCPSGITDPPALTYARDNENPRLEDDSVAFPSAVHRYRCQAVGWTVWVDAKDQIVGVCTEDRVDAHVSPPTLETFYQRGEPFLRKRFPAKVVDEMLNGNCRERTHIGYGLRRWVWDVPLSHAPSFMACCWGKEKMISVR
jgi:hypothetical protein